MVEYLDSRNHKLRKGFYYFYEMQNEIYYFTGFFGRGGLAEFNAWDRGDEQIYLDVIVTRRLIPLKKEEIEKEISKLKNKTNWLEKRIK